MDSRDYIIKAFKHLAHEGKNTQKEVADKIGEDTNQLNEFLNKKRNFSEKKRERIASFWDMSYMDMLFLGKELEAGRKELQPQTTQLGAEDVKKIVAGEMSKYNRPVPITHPDAPIDYQTTRHQRRVLDYQQKEIAYSITDKLIEIEKADPGYLEELDDILAIKLRRLQRTSPPVKDNGSIKHA